MLQQRVAATKKKKIRNRKKNPGTGVNYIKNIIWGQSTSMWTISTRHNTRNVDDFGPRGKHLNSVLQAQASLLLEGRDLRPFHLSLSTSFSLSSSLCTPAPFFQPSVMLKSFCETVQMTNSKKIPRFGVEGLNSRIGWVFCVVVFLLD